jgi:hypothetical protein
MLIQLTQTQRATHITGAGVFMGWRCQGMVSNQGRHASHLLIVRFLQLSILLLQLYHINLQRYSTQHTDIRMLVNSCSSLATAPA